MAQRSPLSQTKVFNFVLVDALLIKKENLGVLSKVRRIISQTDFHGRPFFTL